MIRKISGLLAAAIILGSVSIASATTVHKAVKHHVERGSIMLLENSARPAVGSYGGYSFDPNDGYSPDPNGSYSLDPNGGYSLDPNTRALEILSDEHPPGW
jgi:hypothetical protein